MHKISNAIQARKHRRAPRSACDVSIGLLTAGEAEESPSIYLHRECHAVTPLTLDGEEVLN